jgi:hypothetical protein
MLPMMQRVKRPGGEEGCAESDPFALNLQLEPATPGRANTQPDSHVRRPTPDRAQVEPFPEDRTRLALMAASVSLTPQFPLFFASFPTAGACMMVSLHAMPLPTPMPPMPNMVPSWSAPAQVTDLIHTMKHEEDSEAHQIFRAAAGHKPKNAMPTLVNPVSICCVYEDCR